MLDQTESSVNEERSTGKQPLDDADVRRLLAQADNVVVSRGRSSHRYTPDEVELTALKGPTGKYRAPMLLAGGTLLVGFNSDAIADLLAQ